jgi:hypothetical protein
LDFLVPAGEGELWMIECKAGGTVQPSMAKSILALRHAATSKEVRSLLVYRPSVSAPATRVIVPGAEAIDVHALIAALSRRPRQRLPKKR